MKENFQKERVKISRYKTEYIKYSFGEREHGANRERRVMKFNKDEVVERLSG